MAQLVSSKWFRQIGFLTVLGGFAISASQDVQGKEYLSGIAWQKPPIVTPGKENSQPPSDATVLFDGKDLSRWENGENWPVRDGIAYSDKKRITSKNKFGDCQIHIEWSAPVPPKGQGQGRGNSGLFLMGTYEIQILDSYESETYHDGQAGAIYKQTPPMVNAMRPPGEWNTYDVFWTRPRFADDGSLESPAYITAIHNGVLILNHFELLGNTPYHIPPSYTKHDDLMPIAIQDHGNPVAFRNIWVREIKPIVGKRTSDPYTFDSSTGEKTPIKE